MPENFRYPGQSDTRLLTDRVVNPLQLYESGMTLAVEVLPTIPEVKSGFEEIVKTAEDPKTQEALGGGDLALFLNLAAAMHATHQSVLDVHERGQLIPSILVYRSLADFWDDEFDSLVQKGQRPNPYDVFLHGRGKEVFSLGFESFGFDPSERRIQAIDFSKRVDMYLTAEAEFSDPLKANGLSPQEMMQRTLKLRAGSFGQMAEKLTLLMSLGSGLTNDERVAAAAKMFNFAILGGFLDAIKDAKEDKGTGCSIEGLDMKTVLRVCGNLLNASYFSAT